MFAFTVVSTLAWAGGQHITADIAADGRSVVVHAWHCGGPTAALTATAEGLQDGQRRSVPLAVKRTGDGVFSIDRQWPEGGSWALVLTVAGDRQASALVDLAAGSALKIHSQASTYDPPTPAAVDAALRSTDS
jgi:hypothetical protein